MKGFLFQLSTLLTILTWGLFCVPSAAIENNSISKNSFELRLSLGSFCESVYYPQSGYRGIENVPGMTYALSLGFVTPLSHKLSVEPGIGINLSFGDLDNYGKEGGNILAMPGIDLFFMAQYHIELSNYMLIAELGPELLYFTESESYYIDANPLDPRNGKDIYQKWDIALKPGLVLQAGKHFLAGIEFPIGLRNVRKLYPEYNMDCRGHFRSMQVLLGWRF